MLFLTHSDRENLSKVRDVLTSTHFGQIKTLCPLPGGSHSISFAVNEYVIRFPTKPLVWKTMKREKKILDSICPYFKDNSYQINQIDLVEKDVPYSVSLRINGKICDNRGETEYTTCYQNLSIVQKDRLARSLAQFLTSLHQINHQKLDIPSGVEPIDSWDRLSWPQFDSAQIRDILMTLTHGKVDWNDYSSVCNDSPLAFCHNDLSGSNILINPDNKGVLCGIIDFGNAQIMPRHQDFFPLYKIDHHLVMATLHHYNHLSDKQLDPLLLDKMFLGYIGYEFLSSENPTTRSYLLKLLKDFQ